MLDNIKYSYHNIPTPAYVLEESLLRRNLELIKSVIDDTGVEIILAFKAFALWKTFPIFREYIQSSTASSLSEAIMGKEKMGKRTHTYSPAYKPSEFSELLKCSSHVTFNSIGQYNRFYPLVEAYKEERISCGLRINPEYSEVTTDLYNPASATSRLGIPINDFPEKLPEGIEGLHFHVLCENDSYTLERVLNVVEEKYGHYLPQIKWLNMGGGHLMTHKDYDVPHLKRLLKAFRAKYPHLKLIMEPGSAFVWQTGVLVTEVLDVVNRGNVSTLLMDASFTCHMPDTLEMPYQPEIRGAKKEKSKGFEYPFDVGGNSCLSGDYISKWYFQSPPEVGERLIFEDMIHYTTVKTNMFNGITHPSIWMHHLDETWELLREYDSREYLERMC